MYFTTPVFQLEVSRHSEGFSWELWQKQAEKMVPIKILSQSRRGAEAQHTQLEQQLQEVCKALQQAEPIAGSTSVTAKASHLIKDCPEVLLSKPLSSVAQNQTL